MLKDKKDNRKDVEYLYETILSLKSIEDCEDFFDDLCTIKEVDNMSQRLKAAKLLMDGKTYTEVTSGTNVSSATLSRISRCIQYGKGYKKFIKK